MTYLLIGDKFERRDLIKKIIKIYLNGNFLIDELHFLLDLVIHDIIRLDKDLFDINFYKLCENFKDNFLDYYNDLPLEEIDIDSSNYVLKEEFDMGVREFYGKL